MSALRKVAALVAVALISGPMAASAAIVSGTFDFTVNTWPGAPASTAPFSGSITVSFDNGANILNSTSNILLNSLTVGLGSAIAFDYNVGNDSIEFGGINGGVNSVAGALVDMRVIFFNASTAPYLGYANLMEPGVSFGIVSGGPGGSPNYSSSFTPAPAVPLPAAVWLLLSGLAGLGALGRRRNAV